MDKQYEILIGELIGLARAVDGNEHLISPSSTATVVECLRCENPDAAAIETLMRRVEEEKRKMVPDCFLCANPCGRTSPFDLDSLVPGEVRELKYALLDALRRLARENPAGDEGLFYRGLVVIGMDDYEREDLLPLIRAAEFAAANH